MFCRYCGARLPDDSVFCSSCGRQLSGTGERNRDTGEQKKNTGEQKKTTGEQRQTTHANHKGGGPGQRLRRAAAVCAVLVLALGIRSWILKHPDARSTTPSRDAEDLLQDPAIQEELKKVQEDVNALLDSGQNAPSAQAEPPSAGEETLSAGEETPSAPAGVDLSAPPAGGLVLPDPGLFLNCARYEDKDTTAYGNQDTHMVSYLFSMDDAGKAAAGEYLALLEEPRYQLRLGQQWEDDYTKSSSQLFRIYAYTYTGGEMGLVRDWEDREGNLLISVEYDSGQGKILLTLRYKKSFSFEDPGCQASALPRDLSGNGGESSGAAGGGGVSIPEFARKDCAICDGTGKCTYCGGDGYLFSRASDKEDRNCTHCRNHDGKCTYCDGTGKQKY